MKDEIVKYFFLVKEGKLDTFFVTPLLFIVTLFQK